MASGNEGAGETPARSPLDESIEAAASSAFMGSRLADDARLAVVKRPILRAARLVTDEQTRFNHHVVDSLRAISTTLTVLREDVRRISDDLGSVGGVAGSAAQQLHVVADTVAAMQETIAALRLSIERTEELRRSEHTEMRVARSRFAAALKDLAKRPQTGRADAAEVLAENVREQDLDFLYGSLEGSFRGSRAEIMERQRVYLADVLSVPDLSKPLLDIGSGRGEWLELLRDNGVSAYGVDLSENFATEGKERGLDVRVGDGIGHLSELEPESLSGVTAFHVVEHLPMEVLLHMLDAALSALVPGGVLILETPNPTNVVVGSANFWIDPTHRRPLHPELLRFLVEQRGFVQVEIRYLNPLPPVFDATAAESAEARSIMDFLNRAFSGPADYGVVARRAGRSAEDASAATSERNDS